MEPNRNTVTAGMARATRAGSGGSLTNGATGGRAGCSTIGAGFGGGTGNGGTGVALGGDTGDIRGGGEGVAGMVAEGITLGTTVALGLAEVPGTLVGLGGAVTLGAAVGLGIAVALGRGFGVGLAGMGAGEIGTAI